MSRVVDRGAIFAAGVGVGMAATLAISFLLVIPIEPIYWALALPAGMLIGYYANQRSDRRSGSWLRIGANALFAGAVTGLTLALLLLAVKALFFFGDDGYRDPSAGGRVTVARDDGRPVACRPGADCVFRRYLADGRGPDLAAAGATDPDSFSAFYWNQQLTTARLVLGLGLSGGAGGGLLYGIFRPKLATAQRPGYSTG